MVSFKENKRERERGFKVIGIFVNDVFEFEGYEEVLSGTGFSRKSGEIVLF